MIEIMNWGNNNIDDSASDCTDVTCISQSTLLDFVTTKGMKAPHEAATNDT